METTDKELPFGVKMVEAVMDALGAPTGPMASIVRSRLGHVDAEQLDEAAAIITGAVTLDMALAMMARAPQQSTLVDFLRASLMVARTLMVGVCGLDDEEFRAICKDASEYMREHHEDMFGKPRSQPLPDDVHAGSQSIH